MEKKIEGIIFKQANTEKKNLNIQYDLLKKSENYELYNLVLQKNLEGKLISI